jgi:hypothetical protein
MKTTIEKNYPYQAAGRLWAVPQLRLTILPDGTVALLEEEVERIHRAIANEICGNTEALTVAELEFLCDLTLTSWAQVAEFLGVHRSTLSKWRQTGVVPRAVISLALKKWFWFKLFGEELGSRTVKLSCLSSEGAFLSYARQEAIERAVAEPIEKLRA